MEKEFIPYEQALALKELGFDEPCISFWFKGQNMDDFKLFMNGITGGFYGIQFKAPIYQQAFRWFREKYHLIGGIEYIGGEKPETTWWDIYVVGHFNIDNKKMTMKYQPYEEAELACLNKLIEIVKTK